ncbi:hypothetical protein EDB86DRAFT_3088020 [Lactarius hatsudake]|nr:hypothetical protein EDB86DRAFT_3088020 [Lactarius hatsudake]
MPSISSDSKYLSLVMVDQPAPTLLSMPPSLSSISPMFVPSAVEDQSEPKLTPVLFASIPTLPSTPSHIHSAINNFASTPPSASPTLSMCLPLVIEEQPEPEPEPEPIPLIAPVSTFVSTPLSSSWFTFLPTLVTSATDCQSESEPMSNLKVDTDVKGMTPCQQYIVMDLLDQSSSDSY